MEKINSILAKSRTSTYTGHQCSKLVYFHYVQNEQNQQLQPICFALTLEQMYNHMCIIIIYLRGSGK